MRWVLAATLFSLVSCASNNGVDFSVRLRTDMIPAAEFDRIVVTVDDQNEERVDASTPTFVYSAGANVASYTDISSGERRVRVTLTRLGTEVISQEQVATVTAGGSVTIVITRSCGGVECSGEQSACIGGECVDPRCTPENPSACPSDRCTEPGECGATSQACLTPTCTDGACLVVDEGSCGEGNYCDIALGCRPYDRAVDAGPVDAGVDAVVTPDAGPPPCDPMCTGFDICEDGVCVPAPVWLVDLHADSAAAHDFVTSEGAFERTLALLEEAKANAQPVEVRTWLTRATYRHLITLPKRLKDAQVRAWHLHALPDGRAPRLAMAWPQGLRAAKAAESAGVQVTTHGAPHCVLGPFSHLAATVGTRAFGDACTTCAARERCGGVDAAYLARFGDEDLRALR